MPQITPPQGQIFLTPQGNAPNTAGVKFAGDSGFPGYYDANGVFQNYPTGGGPTTSPNAGALGSGDPSQFDWTSILQNLISGGSSLLTRGSDISRGQQAAGIADPFSGQRGQYQTSLNQFEQNPANAPSAALAPLMNLINNPQSITSQPGYQFGMTQGLEAVNRGAGASGLLNSGNRLAALQNFGQNYAGTWLDRIFGEDQSAAQLGLASQGQGFNQLAQLAGVNAGSPAAAGQLFMGGVNTGNQALQGGLGGLIAALTSGKGGGLLGQGLSGLSSLFSGGMNFGQLGSTDLNTLLQGGSDTNLGGMDLSGIIPGLGGDTGIDTSGIFDAISGP